MPDDNKVITNADQLSGEGAGTGGAGAGNASSSASAESVEVKFGSTTLKVSKDIATVLQAVQAETERSNSEIRAANAALEAKVTALTKPKGDGNAQGPLAGIDVEMFTDPSTAARKIVDTAVAEAVTKLTTAYTADRNQAAFWTEFYSKHPELKDHDFYVQAVLNREYESLKTSKVPDVINKLAETVKGDILKLQRGGKGKGDGEEIEGGTESGQRGSNTGSERSLTGKDKPVSLTDVLKQRAAARAKGAGKPASK